MFVKETYMERLENDRIRMEIIRNVMEIRDTQCLKRIRGIAKAINDKEINNRPLDLVDMVQMIGLADLVLLADAVRKLDQKQFAVAQLYEAVADELNKYISSDQEDAR